MSKKSGVKLGAASFRHLQPLPSVRQSTLTDKRWHTSNINQEIIYWYEILLKRNSESLALKDFCSTILNGGTHQGRSSSYNLYSWLWNGRHTHSHSHLHITFPYLLWDGLGVLRGLLTGDRGIFHSLPSHFVGSYGQQRPSLQTVKFSILAASLPFPFHLASFPFMMSIFSNFCIYLNLLQYWPFTRHLHEKQ